MNERLGATIEGKAELASKKQLEREQLKREKKAEIFELFDANLNYAGNKFQGSNAIKSYTEITGKRLTLARRRHLIFDGNRYGMIAYPSSSQISIDQRGVVISHTTAIPSYSDPKARYVDEVLTPELARNLWEKNEARSLIKAFSSMSPLQMNRKISRGIK